MQIGTAINIPGEIYSEEWFARSRPLLDRFGIISAERELSPVQTATSYPGAGGSLNLDEATRFFDLIGNHPVRGHVLMPMRSIHLPRWMGGDRPPQWILDRREGIEARPKALSSTEKAKMLESFIRQPIEAFDSRVVCWDVAHEGFDDRGRFRSSPWGYSARVMTRGYEIAKSITQKPLFYADYILNSSSTAKWDAIFDWIRSANAERKLIDGLALQLHLPIVQDLAPALDVTKRVAIAASAMGLKVHLSEVQLYLPKWIDAGEHRKLWQWEKSVLFLEQAKWYGRFAAMARSVGAEYFVVWGLSDRYPYLNGWGWRNAANPTLFDEDLNPKPALDATFDYR